MPTRFVRVSLKGTIGSSEVWSVNPVFASAGDAFSDMDYAGALARAEAVAALVIPAKMKAFMSTAVALTEVTVEARTTDGTLQVAASKSLATAQTGTGTASKTPQAATTISLRTHTPGGSGRGRLYWPAVGAVAAAPAFRMTSTDTLGLANDAEAYLAAIQDAVNIDEFLTVFELAVWSRKTSTFPKVTTIQVGDIIDTQRRRRDALPEVYTSVPYTP